GVMPKRSSWRYSSGCRRVLPTHSLAARAERPPSTGLASSRVTCQPRSCSSSAALRPASPPPTTTAERCRSPASAAALVRPRIISADMRHPAADIGHPPGNGAQHTPGLQRRTRRIRRILLVGSLPCLAEENHEPEQPVDAARPRRAVAPLYPDEGS